MRNQWDIQREVRVNDEDVLRRPTKASERVSGRKKGTDIIMICPLRVLRVLGSEANVSVIVWRSISCLSLH